MGGFAGLLGHAAGGYMEEARLDQQRQFEDTQNRRQQMIGLLGKLAGDETVHPDVRTWAAQTAFEGVHAPPNKKWDPDFKKMPLSSGPPVPGPSTNLPNTPPMQVGGAQLPGVNPNAHMAGPPPPPPGIYNTPEQNTAMYAARTGAVAGAQAGSEAKTPVWQRDENGNYRMSFASGTGQPIGADFANAVSPYAMQGRGIRQVVIIDPTSGQPVPAEHDMVGGRVIYNGQLMPPGTPVFESGLLAQKHEGYQQVTDAAGNISLVPVTTTTQKQITQPSGAKPAASAGPPPPPPSVLGAQGQPEAVAGVTGVPPSSAPASASQAAAPTAPKKGAKSAGPPAPPTASVGAGGRVIGHKPVPPALADKIQEQTNMRNSAVDLIDDITRHKQVLDNLLAAGKVAIATNPNDGTWAVTTRMEELSPEEAQVAGDFRQLIEHANLLRGPLGATGFRSKESWDALQAQRGQPLDDPRITAQVMQGMRSRLVALNGADRKILQGQNTDLGSTELTVGGHHVGDVIQHKNGPDVKITKIYPDGTYDGTPMKAAGGK